MVLSQLDQSVYAIDRRIELAVYVDGTLLPAGLGDDADIANVTGVDVQFDIDQLPPTASIAMTQVPRWVRRKQTVEIDAGYDGQLERVFTGQVKRRRHRPNGHHIECVGRTGVLTQPFRSPNEPKSWTAQTAVSAVEDILDDLTPPFAPAEIDPIVENDGSNWQIGTVTPVFMDTMAPSDMIRKIIDVYGHRMYEQKSGTLRIRPLLEAPAPTGYRTYGTQGNDELVETTLSYDDGNIDSNLALGDNAARERRAQGFTPTAAGNATRLSFWVRKIAAPVDFLRVTIEDDDGAGEPNGNVIAGGSLFPGAVLEVGVYLRIDITVASSPRLKNGTLYHLVIDRTGAIDAVNYYQVGADSLAGYADGIANVYNGAAWAAGGGDLCFEVVSAEFPRLRLLDIEDDEDEDQVKKEAIVRGATLESVTPAVGDDPGGDVIQEQITATRFTDSDDLIEGDRHLYSMVYQNSLIQTAGVADEVAARLVDKHHRVLDSIEVEVPFDPRIDLGSTIEIWDKGTAPTYTGEVTGKTGNWWIRAYRHSLTTRNAVTEISLFGGDQSGTDSMAPPQPDFDVRIERELVGAAIQTVVTFIDMSTDQDGWIVNYRWQDDYAGGATDEQGNALRRITLPYDPSVDASINMTLTVTDNDGNTGSVTRAVDVTTDNEGVYAPVIACAGGNTCMATFDGGLSWGDQATPNGSARCCEVTFDTSDPDSPVLVFFGTTTGYLYRSDDQMVTIPEVVGVAVTAGSPITCIRADRHIRERIWATVESGIVLRSEDFGVTWEVYVNLAIHRPVRQPNSIHGDADLNIAPVNGMILSEPHVGKIWVYGGHGDDPETFLCANYMPWGPRAWYTHILEGVTPYMMAGAAADTVIDTVVSHPTAIDIGLGFSNRNPPYVYAPPEYIPPSDADWTDGLFLPAVDCRGVEGNANQLQTFGMVMDNKNFYRSSDGIRWWEITGVLPGTGANRPNDLLQVAAWQDIYLSATDEGIAKSVDYGATWDFFRPQGAPINTVWPGGAIGYDVAIDYRRPRRFDVLAIVTSHAADPPETAMAVRRGHGTWEDCGPLPTGRDVNSHRLWHFPQINDQTAFYIKYTNAGLNHAENLYRTVNLGGAWANVLSAAGALARGSDGRLWATADPDASGMPHAIYYSDDDGATWDLAHEDERDAGGGWMISYFNIAVDPNNHKRVMAVGHWPVANIRVLVTEDAHLGAGATWSEVVPNNISSYAGIAAKYHQPLLLAGENGRWICGLQLAGLNTLEIWVSDNNGADWTKKFERSIAGATDGFADTFRMGNLLFMGGGMIGGAADCMGLISFNNGDEWVELTAHATAYRAYTWDGRFDMLVGAGGLTTRLEHMLPPREGQSWVEGIGVGLDTAMGYANPCSVSTSGLAMQGT